MTSVEMSTALVVTTTRDGALPDAAFELVAAATEIGAQSVTLCLVGEISDDARLGVAGVTRILTAAGGGAEEVGSALDAAIAAVAPDLVLVPFGPEFAGSAASAVLAGMSFVADVVALARGEDGRLVATRPAYGGKLRVDLALSSEVAALLQLRPGSTASAAPGEQAAVESLLSTADGRVRRVRIESPDNAGDDLVRADVIISVGRGVGEEDIPLFADLAKRLNAGLGASRPIVDAGWLPSAHQVGQSGTTVAPKVYVAFGIAGALQHLVGMRKAKRIIAVNVDPSAPIFAIADSGAIADATEVGKEMLKLLC